MTTTGIRAQNRAAVMGAITESATRQLIEVGPTQLSVRAVARDLGMASSAIYRYVRSRDELLTILIVSAYDDLGEYVEKKADRQSADPARRWRAIGLATREWALDNPQRFALIFGSPVPGYAAPQDTIGPATRIPNLLIGVLQQAGARVENPAYSARVARSLQPALSNLGSWSGLQSLDFSDDAFAVGVMAWTHIIGSISFELFGHRHNVVGDSAADRRAYFTFELDVLAELLGLR